MPRLAYANSCSDALSSVKTVFGRAFDGFALKITDVEWIGEKLPEGQFKNLKQFSSQAGKPLKRGYTIQILTPEEVTASVEQGQKIEKNSASNWLLLAESNVNENPREVLVVRLHLTDGNVIETGIKIFGTGKSVDFASGKNQLFRTLGGSSSGISEVEVVHTHPFVSVRVIDTEGRSRIRPVDLSNEDLAEAAEFAKSFPRGITITIKAVTPSGYSFSQSFSSGR